MRRIPNIQPTAVAGSPDGKTLYYVESNMVWALPIGGGTPRKVRPGDYVAVDPAGQYLVVKADEANGVHLFHVPLDGSAEREIPVNGDVRVAATVAMYSNAIGPDGRLLLQVAPPASWFWPSGILDPAKGTIEIMPPGKTADMYGGWTPDGQLVYFSMSLEAVLWRFRPATATDSAR